MDLTVTETDYGADDLSWLGSAHGFESADEVTLVSDDFLSVFTDGRVPSGVCLAKITGGDDDGRYTRYGGASNEVQTVTRTATGGTVDITFDGETAAGVPVVAATTAAEVRAALETLSNIDPGDVAVTGGAGGPFVITFGGQYAGLNVPAIVVDDTDATGGDVTIAQTTAGGTVAAGRSDDFAGHLKKGVKVTAGHMVGAAVVRHGKVVEANLPANNGLDDAAKAAAVGRIIYL